ncbi:DUF58 domain-containing protein [Demequina sp. TTPB684]|uniref:DUF58 domain-containing protein n=1 Tax=unclassified Demequina TaxID=2620311 RepID=UPI001CF39513|nr:MULTISPECIES: DUF58 domain-containing protein [unclassified Demequina]MCB2413592.1 DUF58 domain-containing protein [Demequina sp. TTPB684]UPU88555.1 DUF58 domain-containing protein [Demequina sp. TMPB413]
MYITGWTALLAALGAIPATITRSQDIAWLWMFGVLTLAVIDALAAPSTRSIGVRREVPHAVRLTESTTSTLTLANTSSRRVRGAVRDAWPPSAGAGPNRHRYSLKKGRTQVFTTPLMPTRRGDRKAAHVTLRMEGPLRLAGRQRALPVNTTLRVLPEFASRKHLPARLARLRELDGLSPILMRGAGSEFDSLREYVIGDDVRTIDWRATGRRADVVVRTYRPERDRRVFIVVDTARLSAARVGDAPRLESSIEAALLLSALASRAGDRVQVTAFDRVERARAQGASGSVLMPVLASALAPVEPHLIETDWPALVRLIGERLSQRALVVLLTTVDIALVDSGALQAIAALQRDHHVVLASVDDPDEGQMLESRGDVEAVYTAAAAARGRIERDTVIARIRKSGADVVTALPDDIAPRLADTYLALKASGRL